jgi:hypothetical protein
MACYDKAEVSFHVTFASHTPEKPGGLARVSFQQSRQYERGWCAHLLPATNIHDAYILHESQLQRQVVATHSGGPEDALAGHVRLVPVLDSVEFEVCRNDFAFG